MKIAVLSDIHSNVFALEAILADLKDRDVDQILNLGDIFYGPIAPRETYKLLNDYEITTICGNQDRQIFEASADEIGTNPTMRFVLDELSDDAIKWLKSLPFDLQLNEDIYICHGSPTSDLQYLLENIQSGTPTLRTDDEILKLLNGNTTEVIICGHTHIPRSVTLSSGQLVINPGSVGLPAYTDDEPSTHSMENYSPHASYSILVKKSSGWAVQQIKVPYNFQAAVKKVEILSRDDWAHFLSTGRAF